VNPLVSIIIPTYNAEQFIGRALRSAVVQTYKNIEIIVVDDGSRDGTEGVVRSFDDRRIIYVYQNNRGQGNARNNGIKNCRGEYLTFLDADDLYAPQKVEREVDFLRNHKQYKIVYCNALHVYSKKPNVFYKKRGDYRSGHLLPELVRSSYINPNTVLVAREVFEKCGGFIETRYYPEEWDLWLRMSLAGFEFGYLDEDLVTVEIRGGSNTTMEIQPILKRHAIEMFEKLLPRPVEVDGMVCSADRIIKKLRLKLAMAYLANGRRREFMGAFAQALGRRSWAYLVGGMLMIVAPPTAVRELWKVNQLRNSFVADRQNA